MTSSINDAQNFSKGTSGYREQSLEEKAIGIEYANLDHSDQLFIERMAERMTLQDPQLNYERPVN